jgi:stearoyl-CoA desaturase (delta-9 desaturase)
MWDIVRHGLIGPHVWWISLLISLALGLFFMPQMAAVVYSVYLHRGVTHRSLILRKPTEWVFRILLWLTNGVVPREMAAMHRKHHAYTDVPGDPHSPFLEGLTNIHLWNNWYYGQAVATIDVGKWAKDAPSYGFVDRHSNLGLVISSIVLFVLLGWWGLLALGLYITFASLIAGLVNGWCHVNGYKTYPEAAAFNSRIVAWISAGEGLHNNHHHAPKSPRLRTGDRWFELDTGWLCIKFLCAIGQARLTYEEQ